MNIDKTFGFLGLKPQDLGGFSDGSPVNSWIKMSLRAMVSHLSRTHQEVVFLCGGQPGTEQWSAQEVIAVKECHPDRSLKLSMVLPFPDMTGRSSDGTPISSHPWPRQSHDNLMKLLASADEVKIVSQGPYAAWRVRARDEWVIDNSSGLIFVCGDDEEDQDGEMAGCIRYAKSKCCQILFIDPKKEAIYLE